MLSSLPCFYAFCWSAIPTCCYICNVFFFLFLFMSFFSAADACLSWSFSFITEQQVSPHRLLMQYWLKNHWPDQAFFKHSPHTNNISNSVILCNHYISLLSDLCACVHVTKNGIVKEAIVLQWTVRITSCDFKPGKKRWCCCFVWSYIAFPRYPYIRVYRLYDIHQYPLAGFLTADWRSSDRVKAYYIASCCTTLKLIWYYNQLILRMRYSLCLVLLVTVWQASAQAPGDENTRCLNERAQANDVYPPLTKMLMDSRNYEELISGSRPHWQQLDVDGTGFGVGLTE